MRERVAAGDLGRVHTIQTHFSYFNDNPQNIRNRLENGGGALYDLGCYAIATARYVFDAEPLRVMALIDRDPNFGIDRTVSGLLDFGDGKRADFTVSTQATPYQRVHIVGTAGRLEVSIPFNAPLGGTTTLLFDSKGALDGSSLTVETIPACNMYTLQAEAFARAVRGLAPLAYGVPDAINNMRVIDALFESSRTGNWVNV